MISISRRRLVRKIKDRIPSSIKVVYWNRFLRSESRNEVGFHGDQFVVALAGYLLTQSTRFVETGASAGVTSRWVGTQFPTIRVDSCEPLDIARSYATANTGHLENVKISASSSPDFLFELFSVITGIRTEVMTFWLDAHGYGYAWPLKEEIAFITREVERAFIMIDDFRIPGRPEFGFDLWEGQVCDFDFIKGSLAPRQYFLVYPTYDAQAAGARQLRGVGTIVVGFSEFELPASLAPYFSVSRVPGQAE